MRTSLLIPAVAAILGLLATGCSRDRHVYQSSYHNPLTFTLVDTLNDTTVWSYDVPGGQQLVVDFNYSNSSPEMFKKPNSPATSMKWWVYPGHVQGNYGSLQGMATDSGTVELPGTPLMQKLSYRETTASPAASLTPAQEAAAKPPVRLELEVFEDGSVTFDGKRRTTDEIGPLFLAIYGPRKVIITGKPGTPRANLIALEKTIERKDLVTVVVPPLVEEGPATIEDAAEAAEPAEPMTEPAPEEPMDATK